MSEALGKLREYETVFVVNPDLTEDVTKSDVIERLKSVLENKGAELLREDNWGKKKLSFEVQKHPRGNYFMFHYVGEVGVVEELERTMRNLEHIMRFMTTLHGDVADVEVKRAEVEKMLKEVADKAREEAERLAKIAADAEAATQAAQQAATQAAEASAEEKSS